MVIDVLGVLETGGKPDPAIRQDVRQPLAVATGQVVTVRLRLVKRTGPPFQLAGGDVLKLVAREATIRPSRKFFEVALVADTERGPGHYTGTITAAMTKGLGGRRGVYEVWLVTADGSDPVVPTSEIAINGATTDAPAVP